MDNLAHHLEDLRQKILDLSLRNRFLSFRKNKGVWLALTSTWQDSLEEALGKGPVTLLPADWPTAQEIKEHSLKKFELEGQPLASGRNTSGRDEIDWDKYFDEVLHISTDEEIPNELYDNLDTDDNGHQTLKVAVLKEDLDVLLTSFCRKEKAAVDERGISISHLVYGFLEINEPGLTSTGKPILSPLLIKPVKVQRQTQYIGRNRAGGHPTYSIVSAEPFVINETLKIFLFRKFGFDLPELEENEHPCAYIDRVGQLSAEAGRKWRSRQEMGLALLDFAELAIYKDLDNAQWGKGGLLGNPLVRRIMGEVSKDTAAGAKELPVQAIDEVTNAEKQFPLVLDADASQYSAVMEAVNGQSLVIVGPPGTGKSQTIANIIAALLNSGKSVLFASEKLAALRVVKHKMDQIGLGQFCLEMHGAKSDRQSVRLALKCRDELPPSYRSNSIDDFLKKYQNRRERLNLYAHAAGKEFRSTGKSTFDIICAASRTALSLKTVCSSPESLRPSHFSAANCHLLLEEDRLNTISRIEAIGNDLMSDFDADDIERHPWYGIERNVRRSDYIENTLKALNDYQTTCVHLKEEIQDFARQYDVPDASLQTSETLTALAAVKASPLPKTSWSIYYADLSVLSSDSIKQERLKLEKIRQRRKELSKIFAPIFLNNLTKDTVHALRCRLESIGSSYPSTVPLLSAANSLIDVQQIMTLCDDSLHNTAGCLSQEIFGGAAGTSELPGLFVIAKMAPWASALLPISSITYALMPVSNQFVDFVNKFSSLRQTVQTVGITPERIDNISDILRALDIFKNGGFLKWLSSDWRSARSKLKNCGLQDLSQSKVSEWIDILTQWNDWSNEPAVQNVIAILGSYWKNLSTLPAPLLAAAEWMRRVNELSTEFSDHRLSRTCMRLKAPSEPTLRKLAECCAIGEANQADELVDKLKALGITASSAVNQPLAETLAKTKASLEAAVHFCEEDFSRITEKGADAFTIQDLVSSLVEAEQYTTDCLSLEESVFRKILPSSVIDYRMNEPEYENALSQLLIVESHKRHIENIVFPKEIQSSILGDLPHHPTLALSLSENINSLASALSDMKLAESVFQRTAKASDYWFFFSKHRLSLNDQIDKNAAALAKPGTLARFIEFNAVKNRLANLELGDFLQKCSQANIPTSHISEAYQAMAFSFCAETACSESPELSDFIAAEQKQLINEFQKLDDELKQLQAQQISAKLLKNQIPQGHTGTTVSEYTDLALLRREWNKKQRFISNRELLRRAGTAVRALTPCLMMSPLSIAENLPPEKAQFDVLVMDEASQLRSEAALGAIARAQQVIIVGDPMQLPPTNFFRTAFDIDEDDEDEKSTIFLTESILDQALNALPRCHLRWHYRSRHESLIAFSNREFYDDKLVIFPSPFANNPNYGIRRHFVEGVFTKINRAEAQAIATAVFRQITLHPEESFGVVAMNEEQRSLIEDAVDSLRSKHPEAAEAFAANENSSDPYFVKNLENVQGDERDVIFISMTYGPTAVGGPVPHRFGPINRPDGGRRLNVLFTRARKRMEIFTSMRASDIHPADGSVSGVRTLHDFLLYAETGQLPVEAQTESGRLPDSDFEIAVATALKARGFNCVAQVGVRGYYIDITIKDPEDPAQFILGVECDGATYHSSKCARERDHLREMVLESLGWKLHHVWSTDWFRAPEFEIDSIEQHVRRLLTLRHKVHIHPQPQFISEPWKHDPEGYRQGVFDWLSEQDSDADRRIPKLQNITKDNLSSVKNSQITRNPQSTTQQKPVNLRHKERHDLDDILDNVLSNSPTYQGTVGSISSSKTTISNTPKRKLLTSKLDTIDQKIREEFPDVSPEHQLLSVPMRNFLINWDSPDKDTFTTDCPLAIRSKIDPRIATKYLQEVLKIVEALG